MVLMCSAGSCFCVNHFVNLNASGPDLFFRFSLLVRDLSYVHVLTVPFGLTELLVRPGAERTKKSF